MEEVRPHAVLLVTHLSYCQERRQSRPKRKEPLRCPGFRPRPQPFVSEPFGSSRQRWIDHPGAEPPIRRTTRAGRKHFPCPMSHHPASETVRDAPPRNCDRKGLNKRAIS